MQLVKIEYIEKIQKLIKNVQKYEKKLSSMFDTKNTTAQQITIGKNLIKQWKIKNLF